MLAAENIKVRYGGKQVLGPVSCATEPGKLTAIAGPNGAGKSTLLHAMAGAVPVGEGAITLNGVDIRDIPAWRLAQQRAVLMQTTQIAFPFTVSEIASFGLASSGDHRRWPELLAQALHLVDLTGFEDRYYQQLSGGEQQRVQLARALCQVWQPVVAGCAAYLMLDEPTASLDIKHQFQILRLARDYVSRGGAVLAVLHDIGQIARFADTVILMNHGEIVVQDRPDRVLTADRLQTVFGLDAADLALCMPQELRQERSRNSARRACERG